MMSSWLIIPSTRSSESVTGTPPMCASANSRAISESGVSGETDFTGAVIRLRACPFMPPRLDTRWGGVNLPLGVLDASARLRTIPLMPSFRLKRDQTALLVIDIQERLCAAMEHDALDRMLTRTGAAIEGAQALGLPVLVTEQYPKGLGPTHSLLKMRLGDYTAAGEAGLQRLRAGRAGRARRPQAGAARGHGDARLRLPDGARPGGEGLQPVPAARTRCSRARRRTGAWAWSCAARRAPASSPWRPRCSTCSGRAGTPEFKKVSAAVR